LTASQLYPLSVAPTVIKPFLYPQDAAQDGQEAQEAKATL